MVRTGQEGGRRARVGTSQGVGGGGGGTGAFHGRVKRVGIWFIGIFSFLFKASSFQTK